MTAKPAKLAIIVPCFNEQDVLPETGRRLAAQLEAMQRAGQAAADSFICFVDDGSQDQTWERIRELSRTGPAVRGLRLSRNFGHQNALLAGLLHFREQCDCAISIDADLQQDEAAMPRFVEQFQHGHDIVFGVRRDRATDGWLKRVTAQFFYRLMTLMGVTIVEHHADYRLMSRKALAALTAYEEENLFLRGIVAQLGFRSAVVTFDVRERTHGESKYSLLKMMSFALAGITSFSVAPLRMIAILGALFTLLSMAMAVYVLVSRLYFAGAVPGWASTVLPIYILGGIQLFAIGVIGEYVGRVYRETKRRPRFIIETET